MYFKDTTRRGRQSHFCPNNRWTFNCLLELVLSPCSPLNTAIHRRWRCCSTGALSADDCALLILMLASAKPNSQPQVTAQTRHYFRRTSVKIVPESVDIVLCEEVKLRIAHCTNRRISINPPNAGVGAFLVAARSCSLDVGYTCIGSGQHEEPSPCEDMSIPSLRRIRGSPASCLTCFARDGCQMYCALASPTDAQQGSFPSPELLSNPIFPAYSQILHYPCPTGSAGAGCHGYRTVLQALLGRI